jgi:hypothetical protein
MKSIFLMTTAIFLLSAPSPDSKTVSEISVGFLSAPSETALSAAEVAPKAQSDSDTDTDTDTVTPLPVQSENEEIKPVD